MHGLIHGFALRLRRKNQCQREWRLMLNSRFFREHLTWTHVLNTRFLFHTTFHFEVNGCNVYSDCL